MGEPNPDAVDYYSRIGVSPDADIETIERSRKQADRRFSPMSSSADGDEQRHMRINAASNVLEDTEERRRYDAFYDAFGRVEGTAVYDTVSGGVADAVIDDDTLFAHLRGFVEMLGPIEGARTFGRYYEEVDQPVTPEALEVDSLPNGYSTADAGFGVAAWSYHEATPSCDLALWLTGGRDLWRSALQDPDDVAELVASLDRDTATTEAPTTGVADGVADDSPATDIETASTQVSGHPSSGAPSRDLPSEYTPPEQRDEDTETSVTERLDGMGVPSSLQRMADALSYVGSTGAWSLGSGGAVATTGLASIPAVVVILIPLLAVLLLLRTSLPGLNEAVVGSLGVPIVSPDAPMTTPSVAHYCLLGLLVAVPGWVTGRLVVPTVRERKDRGLPRDAWLVFGLAFGTLMTTLVVGLGRGTLPQPVGVAATALVTAFTFQASMDVGAPWLLSRLCRGVATGAAGLASGIVAVLGTVTGLRAVAPDAAAATASIVATVPALSAPVVSAANATVIVVGFGALAAVPLSLATLYSLTYAVESIALRIRSRSYS